MCVTFEWSSSGVSVVDSVHVYLSRNVLFVV